MIYLISMIVWTADYTDYNHSNQLYSFILLLSCRAWHGISFGEQ